MKKFSRFMKKLSLFPLIFYIFCTIIPAFCQEVHEKTKYFELDNGLKVFLYKKETLPLVNIVFAVNAGSKNETEETNGIVHLLEHCILFRGTEFRSGKEICQDIRKHGAYFNAHTTHDLAFFEMSLPSEHVEFALKTQKEILFHLKITPAGLAEEKQVILEELSQIHDDPVKYTTSLAYQNLFAGHPYQHPVYGNEAVIKAVTPEEMTEFHKTYFVPANCALAVVGDFSLPAVEEKIKSFFGDLKNSGFTPPEIEMASPLSKTVEIEKEMDVNVAYIVIGTLAPDYNHPQQYAIDVLTEILGRGINPMLNYALRGRRTLAQSLSMDYNSLRYGGAALIYLTLDPKNLKAARREALQFLKQTRRMNFSKKDFLGEEQFYALDFLESAKNQIQFKAQASQEKALAAAASLVRFMLLNETPERGKYLENIAAVSSSDIRKAAGDHLSKDRYVIVSVLPQKKK